MSSSRISRVQAEERREAAERRRKEAEQRAEQAARARQAQTAKAAEAGRVREKPRTEKTGFDGKTQDERVEMSGRSAEAPRSAGELQAYKIATDEVKKQARQSGEKLTTGEARERVDEKFGAWVKEAGQKLGEGASEEEIRQSFPGPTPKVGAAGEPVAETGGPAPTSEVGGPTATTPGAQQAQEMLDLARQWLGTSETSSKYVNELLPEMNKYDPRKLSASDPWCAHFATYVMNKVLGSNAPIAGDPYCPTLKSQFQKAGRWHDQGSGYTPQPGDMILFNNPPSHVGIVERVENGKVWTIEGNTSDSCNRRCYNLNDPGIGGYGQVIGERIPGTVASDPNDLKSVAVSGAGTAGRNAGAPSGGGATNGSGGSSGSGGGGGGASGVGSASGSAGSAGSAAPAAPPFDTGAIDRSLASKAGIPWDEFLSYLLSFYEQKADKLDENNKEFQDWLDKKGLKGQPVTKEMKAQFLAEKLSGAIQANGGGKAGLAKAAKQLGIPEFGNLPKGQVGDWIRQAMTALRAAGVPVEKMNPQDIALIIQRESGGNPNAQNNWDSNAKKGTPSIGLMQTIGPTFDAHKLPGHGNIRDPVDNIIAGVRYAIARYGSVSNVPGVKAVRNGGTYVGY